jgi:hypothetical protein
MHLTLRSRKVLSSLSERLSNAPLKALEPHDFCKMKLK